jgi:hypothetical protein
LPFKEDVEALSHKLIEQRNLVKTEEATKNAFISPFLQILGYDISNPLEVIPEYTADVGIKNGEKVDYAISIGGKIRILVECKPINADIDKYQGQLYRYFSVVNEAKFGILTNGDIYRFYSDLDKANVLDKKPFFEFVLSECSDVSIQELESFSKKVFDLDKLTNKAESLKYSLQMTKAVREEIEDPSEDFVKLLTSKVYDGRFTSAVKEKFTELSKKAISAYIKQRSQELLQSAIAADNEPKEDVPEPQPKQDSEIETTDEEWQGFYIAQAIASEITVPEHVTIRDAKSYCAILFDDNNRKPIIRLRFNSAQKHIGVFSDESAPSTEQTIDIDRVEDIYRYRKAILSAIRRYL